MPELGNFIISIICLVFSGFCLNDALGKRRAKDWFWFIILCFLGIINLI